MLSSRPAVTVSPDGSTVVFAAALDGVERLYRRHASSFDATAISGTEGGSNPVISPDGRWLAFMTITKLVKIPLAGGLAVPLADVNDPRGLSWDSDDSIIYTPTTLGGVFRIAAAGGTPTQITTPKPGAERTHRWPQELPGGVAVIYTVGSFSNPDNYDDAVIEAQMVATGERRTLLAGAAMARYLPTGHLLFARGTNLFLVPFDARKVEVTGSPNAVIQGLGVDATTGAAHVAVSRSGTLVYISAGSDASALRVTEVDQTGRSQPLQLPAGAYSEPAVSPDGQQLAVSVIAGGGRDIWVHHRQRRTFTRLTFEGQNVSPVWTRDGSMIYYVSMDAAERGSVIHRRPSDGSREAEHIATMPERGYLSYLTPDERSAVIELVSAGAARSDLHQIALAKDAKSVPLLATRFNEFAARLSPDGRWMAYVSNESGRPHIYVRPAAGGGGRWQVSTDAGEEPKWSPDGRELYYRYGNVLMGATVRAGAVFEASPPRQIISGIYNLRNESGISYDVDARTGRFVMIRPGDEAAEAHSLRVMVNWFQEIRDSTTR